MADFKLYPYQEEVVQRALQGENIIIWLPTGSGKTRAAVYVAAMHLKTTQNAKVMVLVNKVHLVDQHFTKEFKPLLGSDYKLRPVSGDTEEKDFFGLVVKDSDVVICTAQILHNALMADEETKHVELSDITLLIIDECHGTNKDSVYNKVMALYLEKKLKGQQPLPQILGLTASPGTGGAKILDRAVEHVLQICANLDSAIVSTEVHTPELKEKVVRPVKTFDIVEKRQEDPLGDHLKWMMQQIHEFMILPEDFQLRECGTQDYEADVVNLERRGVKESNRQLAESARHLRQYNDALLINDTLRMKDAYSSLEEFYITKLDTEIDGTDFFLMGLFQENLAKLRELAGNSRYENPKMSKLESTLLKQFGPDVQSRGMLFSRTRKSTHCLLDWVCTNQTLQDAGIKAAIFTGTGNGTTHMTQNEQTDTIRNFRLGTVNLLISTSVGEEGLDIPECNLVVRYGLLTNEIAQLQAIGRARAKNSQYSVVAEEGGREVNRERTNEILEELMVKAISQIQRMSPEDFRIKIAELQRKALAMRKLAESQKIQRRSLNTAASVQFLCLNCSEPVATGADIKLLAQTHYVNVNPSFKKHYKVGGQVILEKTFEDWEPGRTISCNNGKCTMNWGHEIKYKKVVLLPKVAIKNFALKTAKGIDTVKKWKDAPFDIEDFSFEQYHNDNFSDSDSD